MRYFLMDGKEITEEEAKHIEAQNREILKDGTVEELLQIRHIIYYEQDVTGLGLKERNYFEEL